MTPLSLGMGVGLTDLGGPSGVALATPGDLSALGGVSSFTRADTSTCRTYWDVNGVLQTVAAAVLRNSHYVGTTRTVLLETGYTNLRTFASDWNHNGPWVPTRITPTFDQVGPTGVAASATRITEDGSNNTHFLNTFNVTITADVSVLVHCIVKSMSRSSGRIRCIDAGSNGFQFYFNLATGTVSSLTAQGTGTATACGIEPHGDFFVVWGVGKMGPGATTCGMYCHTNNPAGTDSYQGTSVDSLNTSYAMIVQSKSFPVSPINTPAGSSVAGATDALTLVGTSRFGGTNTLFYHYYDLATLAWTDSVGAYTSGNPIVPPVDRAYSHLAVLRDPGLTAAQCKALIGGTFP